jgi:hypothetical protein
LPDLPLTVRTDDVRETERLPENGELERVVRRDSLLQRPPRKKWSLTTPKAANDLEATDTSRPRRSEDILQSAPATPARKQVNEEVRAVFEQLHSAHCKSESLRAEVPAELERMNAASADINRIDLELRAVDRRGACAAATWEKTREALRRSVPSQSREQVDALAVLLREASRLRADLEETDDAYLSAVAVADAHARARDVAESSGTALEKRWLDKRVSGAQAHVEELRQVHGDKVKQFTEIRARESLLRTKSKSGVADHAEKYFRAEEAHANEVRSIADFRATLAEDYTKAKSTYREALARLEAISNEIHELNAESVRARVRATM